MTLIFDDQKQALKDKLTNFKRTILGDPMPNIPWQDRPSDNRNPVWRYSRNPVIPET